MPRKKLSNEEKLKNALERSKCILSKYDGSRDYIAVKSSDYQRTKDTKLKHIYNDYVQLVKAERVIKDLSKNDRRIASTSSNHYDGVQQEQLVQSTAPPPRDQPPCQNSVSSMTESTGANQEETDKPDVLLCRAVENAGNGGSRRESTVPHLQQNVQNGQRRVNRGRRTTVQSRRPRRTRDQMALASIAAYYKNCQRLKLNQNNELRPTSPYFFELIATNSSLILQSSKKFKHVQRNTRYVHHFFLCTNCHNFLCEGDNSEKNL